MAGSGIRFEDRGSTPSRACPSSGASTARALRERADQNGVGISRGGQVGLHVAARLLPLGELDVARRQRLVRDLAEQVGDDVEAAALLVVGVGDVPRRPRRCRWPRTWRRGPVSSRTTGCTTCRSMSDSFQTLRGSSMRLCRRRVCSSALTSSQYFSSMIPESTIACSTPGDLLEEPVGLLLGAEAHDPLDAGAVVPAAVEDHDLAGRRAGAACSAGCTSATSPARSARAGRRRGTPAGSPAR